MMSDLLKQQMQSLPGDQFAQVWTCIDEIDASLAKAGSTALLAFTFIQTRNEERVLAALQMQALRIEELEHSLGANQINFDAFSSLQDAYDKLERKNAKLKKKSSK